MLTFQPITSQKVIYSGRLLLDVELLRESLPKVSQLPRSEDLVALACSP